jgi:hypothetical protein
MASTAAYRYMYEHRKDLAGHIWAVAVHHPDRKITVAADGRPTSLPWDLDGLHEASGNAMARGKRVWNEELRAKVGSFDKFDLHYGLARYLLVPLSANLTLDGYRPDLDTATLLQQRAVNDVAQVRVERMQVQTRNAMLAQFVPAAAITFDKPFRPLCPGRERAPRLPRIESELQALFIDAGELVAVEEEEEEEHLSGATRVASSINNVSSLGTPNEALHSNPPQVYESWAAGPPHTPTSPTWAWLSPAPSPPPVPRLSRKRISTALGSGIADITKRLRQNTVAMHTRRRVANPTVDSRGSPIERTDRPVFNTTTTANAAQPILRLDTPGRVIIPHQSKLLIEISFPLTFPPLFFRHTGRFGNSLVDPNGQQSHENVNLFLFSSLSLEWNPTLPMVGPRKFFCLFLLFSFFVLRHSMAERWLSPPNPPPFLPCWFLW